MKNILSVLALTLLCIALMPEMAQAQKRNIWKGGHAGRATEWNCPRNWSLGIVPDAACVAVIEQDYRSTPLYPVISASVEVVQCLLLFPGARLEIGPKGRLEVALPDACLFGGELLNRGQLATEENLFETAKPIAGAQ